MATVKIVTRLAERQLVKDLEKASKRGETLRFEPRASAVSYDKDRKLLIIELVDGTIFSRPVSKIQGLARASEDQISQVEIMPQGVALHWENLDLDFGIAGLVAGVLGTQAWMAELGRKGGQVQSEAKATAARANGLRGGRPSITRTVTVTSVYSMVGKGLISCPKQPNRFYRSSADWSTYGKLVDAYEALKHGYSSGTHKNALLGFSAPQKETFGHVSSNVHVYQVSATTEARTNADLALAA
jgi:hypothetical protein